MDFIKKFIGILQGNENTEFCKCKRMNSNAEFYCDSIELLLNMTKTNKNFENEKAKQLYEVILILKQDLVSIDCTILNIEEDNGKQIQKDLARTYPNNKMFRSLNGQLRMLNVLKAYSNYDKQIRKNILK
jgi:hypothetical protein